MGGHGSALRAAVAAACVATPAAAAVGPSPAPRGPAELPPPVFLDMRREFGGSAGPLRPWLSLAAEFNDPVIVNAPTRRGDASTGAAAGLAFSARSPEARLDAGYAGVARAYARADSLNRAPGEQFVQVDGAVRFNRRLVLSVLDLLVVNPPTAVSAPQVRLAERRRSWSNSVTAGLSWQAVPRTALRAGLTTSRQRFDTSDEDVSVHGVQAILDRRATRRLTASAGYEFMRFHQTSGPRAAAHVARFGAGYHLTPSLTVWLAAGPVARRSEDDTQWTPVATAKLERRRRPGVLTLQYDRSLGTAGEFGGPSDNRSVSALLRSRPRSRLTVEAAAVATVYELANGAGRRTGKLRTEAVDVRASYQMGASLAWVGSFTRYRQRTDATLGGGRFAQNRFSLGARLSPAAAPHPFDEPERPW